jgi:hypothetical protein
VLESGDNATVHEKIDGWTVFAQTRAVLEQFKRARSASSDRLADEKLFEDAYTKLPDDAVARAYVNGKAVQAELDRALSAADAPPGISQRFGTFNSLGAAATARDDGARIDGFADLRLTPELPSFAPKLPEELPAGALLYYSFGRLDALFRQILREVERAQPDARDQLRQVETVLGLTLEKDVFPLFAGESAFAIYRASPLPTFELVLAGVDQQKAERLLTQVGAIAQLAGADVSTATIAGANLKTGLPVAFAYAEQTGSSVSEEARANTRPLRSTVEYIALEDDGYRVGGFVGIR